MLYLYTFILYLYTYMLYLYTIPIYHTYIYISMYYTYTYVPIYLYLYLYILYTSLILTMATSHCWMMAPLEGVERHWRSFCAGTPTGRRPGADEEVAADEDGRVGRGHHRPGPPVGRLGRLRPHQRPALRCRPIVFLAPPTSPPLPPPPQPSFSVGVLFSFSVNPAPSWPLPFSW